nr:unnamed protein product [Digitaria exilis]
MANSTSTSLDIVGRATAPATFLTPDLTRHNTRLSYAAASRQPFSTAPDLTYHATFLLSGPAPDETHHEDELNQTR